MGFVLFARYRDLSQLGAEINDIIVNIPFGGVDGLEASIGGILKRMKHEISAKVPHAFRSARNDVLAVTRAVVEARVQAGDVILR
jgi:hypothetical protein